ncbi:MAG: arginase [Deinococcales bacterium]
MTTSTSLAIIALPMDLGAGRRGVDMGPSALRLAKLAATLQALGYQLKDLGNITVGVAEALEGGEEKLPYGVTIAKACQELYLTLSKLDRDTMPIILGGDHSISMGSVAGVAAQTPKGKLGVIWLDAHADLNTPESSPSGNIHGMPLAHLLGFGSEALRQIWGGGAVIEAQDLLYIGLRSVDPYEKSLIRHLGIESYTMSDIDQEGIPSIARKIISKFEGYDQVHLSFDADALDPSVAPGVGTPVAGGLSYREAHLLMELLARSGMVTSLDVVEVNPILDSKNRTAEVMVEMVASLFGRTIL